MNYSRKYIEALSKDNNFIQNNLEKVVRLLGHQTGILGCLTAEMKV